MTSISSLLSSTAQTTTSALTETASTDEDTSTQSTEEESSSSSTSDVELSTRAQKIQALGEEFFPDGPQSITISSDFLQRLYDYDLISADELSQLQLDLSDSLDSSDDSALSVEQLDDDLGSLIDYLQAQDADQDTIDTLKQAQEVINNFDDFGSYSSSLSSLISEVKAISDDSGSLSDSQQDTLDQLQLTLTVASSISSDSVSNDAINSYLSITGL